MAEPRYEVVVRRTSATGAGPLAPWRFSIAVFAGLAIAGWPLWLALTDPGASPGDLERAFLRVVLVAAGAWIATGVVNRILRSAEARLEEERLAEEAAARAAREAEAAEELRRALLDDEQDDRAA